MARLRLYGYPVEAFAGHGVAATSGVAGVDDAAVSALGKIEQLLPLRLRSRFDELEAATVVPFRDLGSLPDRRIVMALAHAVSARRVTTFDYVDGRGATSRREIEPVRLVRLRHAWYLAAFDLDRDDWRTFRVDRIASIDVSDVQCAARSGPDPVELVSRAAPPSAFEHRAVVAIAATPDEIRRLVPRAIADLEPRSPTCHGTTATIGTDDLEWLAAYLMGLPWSFEVLEPHALRRRIADRAGAIAARHAQPV